MKQRILEYSRVTFLRVGFRSVTMDAIAVGMGISKKTIYQFFKDKDELILDIINKDIEYEQIVMQNISEQAKTPLEELLLITNFFNNRLSSINPTCIYDLQRYHSDIWKKVIENKECRTKVKVQTILNKGIELGLFRENLNTEFCAIFLDNSINNMFDGISYPLNKFSLPEVHIQTMMIYLYGITTEKGRLILETEKNKILKN